MSYISVLRSPRRSPKISPKGSNSKRSPKISPKGSNSKRSPKISPKGSPNRYHASHIVNEAGYEHIPKFDGGSNDYMDLSEDQKKLVRNVLTLSDDGEELQYAKNRVSDVIDEIKVSKIRHATRGSCR